ncbi:unnamed protein product [Paramecium octaurelia]|uniref:Peptidase C1A papain C-terminal domain-containing protein n=1 Tax=Paramecium octaurelia TaxID=43137 RepID=A0A8S1Y7Z7_PAROT|nr:unnamed protein product [Paramecium octaurelia]
MFIITLITSALGLRFQSQTFYDFVNSQQSTWVSGHNQRWEQFNEATLKTQMGTFLDEPEFMKLPESTVQFENLEIPESFDARVQWPNCDSIKEVRDQSTCGSCWAFGAAEAMSDRLCIATGKQTRISTEDLLTCCGITCGMGCNGGFPSGAWNYFKNKGLVTGDLYGDNSWCRPYTFPPCDHHVDDGKYGPCGDSQPTPACVKSCTAQSGRNYDSDKIRSVDSYSVSSKVEQIQNEIMTFGPVEASFTVYEDFLTYKSGVYQNVAGASLGGHAVKIIGWGVEKNVPYWLVVNSWNEGWGENGLFKILRGSNHVGIEGGIYAGRLV